MRLARSGTTARNKGGSRLEMATSELTGVRQHGGWTRER
jgi:hypothetical protein